MGLKASRQPVISCPLFHYVDKASIADWIMTYNFHISACFPLLDKSLEELRKKSEFFSSNQLKWKKERVLSGVPPSLLVDSQPNQKELINRSFQDLMNENM